ncbi:MAG: hypothetical protein AAF633_03665 [Chloroflexota bacterium]
MPAYYGERLSANQLETMVSYLNDLGASGSAIVGEAVEPIGSETNLNGALVEEGAAEQEDQGIIQMASLLNSIFLAVAVVAILVIAAVIVLPRIRGSQDK